MTWSIRGPNDEIQPVRKPEPVEPDQLSATNPDPALRDLNEAVDIARAGELPGSPTGLVNRISVLNYEPPEGAIRSALGS